MLLSLIAGIALAADAPASDWHLISIGNKDEVSSPVFLDTAATRSIGDRAFESQLEIVLGVDSNGVAAFRFGVQVDCKAMTWRKTHVWAYASNQMLVRDWAVNESWMAVVPKSPGADLAQYVCVSPPVDDPSLGSAISISAVRETLRQIKEKTAS